MYSKKCFKCETVKEITEFYKHPKMGDGYLNKCKECNKKDTRDNYKINIDHYKAYDKYRARLPHRVEDRKKYNKTESGKRVKRESGIRYKKKYPNAYKAKILFGNAVRDNRVTRGDICSECSSDIKIQGHHDDYNFPLVVRWLCLKCHNEWHRHNTPLNRV